MTQRELIALCTSDFYTDFARTAAGIVTANGAADSLWAMLMDVDSLGLEKQAREKFEFRASYIMERIYFGSPEEFEKYIPDFMRRFPTVTNGSMKRHFAKMCHHILKRGYRPANLREIAETCMDWVIDPAVKIAVKGWSLEILALLSKEHAWIREILPDLLEALSKDGSPGAQSIVRWMTKSLPRHGMGGL